MHFRANAPSYCSRRHLIARAVAEVLEPRTLLSLSPIGSEFHVNSFVTDAQQNPAVAADGDGDFVIAWQSAGQEGAGNFGIFAQRFSATGVAQGAEIHVNTSTAGAQTNPTIAI